MKKKVYAYLHTHWDFEWYRDSDDFNIRLIDVLDAVIDELKKENAPYFYLDGQIVALLNYLKFRPEKKEIIINLINNKKLGVGPFFVSADTYLVNYNCMLKNLELGLKYSKLFKQKEYIGYICDVFGISNSIFEALKLNNIKNAIIWRGVNPQKINNNCNFIKNDINTLWLAQGYFNDFLHAKKINIQALKKYLDRISMFSKDVLLLPIGADHLGILKNANKIISNVNSLLDDYEITLTSPFEYFKKTKFSNITKEKEFLDNSETYILGGVYSSRIQQKIKNSIIQNKISRITEPLNFFLNSKYIKNIEYAYETLILNHAHDGICGCSLDSVNRALDYRFDKCDNILNSINMNILANFKNKNIVNNDENKIGLFNLSNKKNLKVIEINSPVKVGNAQILSFEEKFLDEHLANIYKIPVTEEIVPIYKQLVEISSNNKMSFSNVKILKPTKKTKVSLSGLENDFIKLSVIKNRIKIINKKTKSKFFIKITDIKDIGDSYNFAPYGKYNNLELLKTKVLTDDKIMSSLRLQFKNLNLDVFLNNYSEFLEFSAEINNKTKNHKLQLVVETDDNVSKTLSQDAIGIVERNIDYNYRMQDYMPVKRPYELKTNSYPMQNFVIANNIITLTKGLNEYEIYKNQLRICLLRCFGTISNPKNPARAIPAGPNLKIDDAENIKKIKVNFALSFGNPKDAFNYLEEFNKNYTALLGEYKKEKKFVELKENELFFGIFKDKNLIYNLKTNKCELV